MFLPEWLAIPLLIFWIVIGAVLAAILGHVSANLMRLERRRPWLDAGSGAAAILLLLVLVLVVSRGTTTIVDGRTLGARGIVLDHLIVWAIGLVTLGVVGRQIVEARTAHTA